MFTTTSIGKLQPETLVQLDRLQAADIIQEVRKEDLHACCPVFTLFQGASKIWPYNGGDATKFRLIYDARKLNRWFTPPKGRLPSPFAPLARPDDQWFASIDFKNAFWNVKLSEAFSKYFGLEANGHYYRWKVMPFGWNMAPFLLA
jgi:hypothetical protein